MDNRVFEQDVFWVNVRGEAFRLTEMDAGYRRNVIQFLLENVEYFHAESALREALEATDAFVEGELTGSLLAFLLGCPAIGVLSPREWLESTPLMRRLRQLTPDALGTGC